MRVISPPLFVIAFALCGCAGPGVQVTPQQAQAFKVGVSTYDEVVAALGSPTATYAAKNGARVATYSYSADLEQAHNAVPYVRHWITGYDSHSSTVTFTFDESGVLASAPSTN
jgi:outer membrane protein assembly factor BamE (lipoprotein component of BamABCDE complex)